MTPDAAKSEPGAERAVARLAELVGEWQTFGHLVDNPDITIEGTDVYELLAGGHFLIHHVDVRLGDEAVRAIEVIGGYDTASGSFEARAYDNDGNTTLMRATPGEPGVWRFTGGGDVAPAAQQGDTEAVRSTLRVSPEGDSMHARWERSPDGAVWTDWMDVAFTRRARSSSREFGEWKSVEAGVSPTEADPQAWAHTDANA